MILKHPAPASVSESEAITDDVLVSAALEMFGEASNEPQAQAQAPTAAATRVAGVIKSPSNHLVSPVFLITGFCERSSRAGLRGRFDRENKMHQSLH